MKNYVIVGISAVITAIMAYLIGLMSFKAGFAQGMVCDDYLYDLGDYEDEDDDWE